MKKFIFTIALLATTCLQAQILNVNNNDGSYLPVETSETRDITFYETDKSVTLTLSGGIKHSFNTGKIESISPKTDNSTLLTYDLKPIVTFDSDDKKSFNEVVETIPTEETTDNDYGDFVENFSVGTVV